MASLVNSIKFYRKINTNSSQTFPKNKRKEYFLTHSVRPLFPDTKAK